MEKNINNWLGMSQDPFDHFFQGALDYLRIYNQVLSEEEIEDILHVK